jgi:hypothetical protein
MADGTGRDLFEIRMRLVDETIWLCAMESSSYGFVGQSISTDT